MTETIYQRTERAWFLAVDLDVSVQHLIEALQDLTAGEIGNAHWGLWRGGFTKIQPGRWVSMEIQSGDLCVCGSSTNGVPWTCQLHPNGAVQ